MGHIVAITYKLKQACCRPALIMLKQRCGIIQTAKTDLVDIGWATKIEAPDEDLLTYQI